MNDCLERAMFIAAESYSHSAYEFEDRACEESDGDGEVIFPLAEAPGVFALTA